MTEPDHTQRRDVLARLPRHVSGDGTQSGRGVLRHYVRFAALGDSATFGIGDRVAHGWRGWARLLADAMAERHDVSFCNVAVSGATTADVRHRQLNDALAHRPHLASLLVGLNDVMRSTWDPDQIRADLLHCAEALTALDAVLVLPRFHDHSRVLGLPRLLARPMADRIEALNAIYDDLHATYGGLRVDLSDEPSAYGREFWCLDRLHPSELGHRVLAGKVAALLHREGLEFPLPRATPPALRPRTARDVWALVVEGGPWLGRRAMDFGPWAARLALTRMRARLAI